MATECISNVGSNCITRVKSGKFRHQVNFGHTFANSVHPDETAPYELSH